MTAQLTAATAQGAGYRELSEAISRAVAAVVPHDGLRLAGTTPTAGAGPASFSFWHEFDPDLGMALLHIAFAGDDPCSMEELARRSQPVGVVGTGSGRRHRAARRLLADHGVGSELRLVLRDTRGVWGMLELLRAQGGRAFDEDDANRATQLGATLIAVLRAHVTAGPAAPVAPRLPTGVIVVGPDHAIRAATPQAHGWREQLQARQRAPDFTSTAYCAGLSMQARRRTRDPHAPAPLVVGPPASYGRWVTCHAQPLTNADSESGSNDVAIIVETATSEQLLPSFCDWYGITVRERQVIEHLLDAAAPKQIARRLGLSAHTVNDHLKATYRKTGTSGRDELLTALTG
ncbi:LuxR C-terminal-related transcriptional regulator [Amycolatopsis sp. MEPSY49]|uniref:LuxR C-terminal-related transcriptional regulator n=1 Tax=Amycolatopsis sp. MEPSY49 TaxID=3151600 RepID=UPI003EF0989C